MLVIINLGYIKKMAPQAWVMLHFKIYIILLFLKQKTDLTKKWRENTYSDGKLHNHLKYNKMWFLDLLTQISVQFLL